VSAETKSALRTELKTQREELAARDPDAGETIAGKFPLKLLERYGPVVAAYWPIGSELDPRPLMTRLAYAGARIALPRIGSNGAMSFHQWQSGDRLEDRPFGLKEPLQDTPVLTPTLVLTPLLGFDRDGNRLGYGKGHYDQALTGLRDKGRVFACGLAFPFHEQEVERVPAEPHDIPLDWVVTTRGSIPIFMMRTFAQGRD